MIFLPFLFVGFVVLFVWGFMHLWNWIVPLVFGLTILSFWQAAGLLLISKILFEVLVWAEDADVVTPTIATKETGNISLNKMGRFV